MTRSSRWPAVKAEQRAVINGRALWHYQCPYCKLGHGAYEDEGDTPLVSCDTYKRVRLRKPKPTPSGK